MHQMFVFMKTCTVANAWQTQVVFTVSMNVDASAEGLDWSRIHLNFDTSNGADADA